jgi:hypothetical protein
MLNLLACDDAPETAVGPINNLQLASIIENHSENYVRRRGAKQIVGSGSQAGLILNKF